MIKNYTDLEQSRKLAEILPLESADMFYNEEPEDETYPKDIVDTEYPMVLRGGQKHFLEEYGIPCWSLSALLNVLPIIENYYAEIRCVNNRFCCCYTHKQHIGDLYWRYAGNPVDACVAMIEKLHELKIL